MIIIKGCYICAQPTRLDLCRLHVVSAVNCPLNLVVSPCLSGHVPFFLSDLDT